MKTLWPRRRRFEGLWIRALLFIGLFCLWGPRTSMALPKRVVAILPFRVHAMKPMEHLAERLQEMLSSRMAKRGYEAVGLERVNRDPRAYLKVLPLKDMINLGRDLRADWVILGNVTQVGERFSLDVKVTDVSGKRSPFYVYMIADDVDALPEAADRIVLSIDHQILGAVQVDSVLVRGNRRVEKEAILAVVKTKKGDLLDYDRLDEDLRAVYKMGFFQDVVIEMEQGPRGKIIIFKVKEKPSIGKIVFEGNKHVKDDDLMEQLGIKLYSVYDPNEVKQSINTLVDYYRQKGYYNVEIKANTSTIPNNEVLVEYRIEENEKVYIRHIKFVGNKAFDDDDLKDIMETKEKGLLSWITSSGYLDKKKLEFDVQKISAFYANHGFIHAKVGEPKVSYKKGEGLTITIEVQEGPRYAVNKVSIRGDLIKSEEELLAKTHIGREKYFNREAVRKDVQALRSMYADEGYAYAEVGVRTGEQREERLIDVIYVVSKGKKVRFERINISGNSVTRDKVIRRELKVAEGDYFSAQALRRSTENLQRLGYFEDVKIQTKKGSRDDLMVLNVDVKERPTGTFSLGAGYSSADQVFGVLEVAQNNLFGRGQKLKGSVKLGTKSSQFDIRFVEPWLLDTHFSLGLDAFNTSREFDEYTRDRVGGSVRLGFPLKVDDFTRGSVRYTYDHSDISDVADTAAIQIQDMVGVNVTSSMTFDVKRDSRNRLFNTSKGSLNSITYEYAGGILGGDVYFDKVLLRSAWYFPLWWDTNVMLQGRWGIVKQRSGGKLPIYQKFRIGGINTVRGFNFAEISPRDPVTGDRIGGEKMMVYNFEYRFPLLKEQGIIGVVFFDAGNVFSEDEEFTFSGIRRSAGGGIRWYSPMGPIRLEYGINLDQQPGESTDNIEFSLGGVF